MIEKDLGLSGPDYENFTVYCDKCGEEQYYEDLFSWGALMEEIKIDGWKSVKTKAGWEHYCSKCNENKEG